MKVGFGLYQHMLKEENYKFARQAGATHIVAHLTDYFYGSEQQEKNDQPVGNVSTGWGKVRETELWSYEELDQLKQKMAEYGLELAALENISPAFWHDILLAGPKRDEQIEDIKTLVRNMGKAGIPVLGYNFSLAGVTGRIKGPFARGNAYSVGMDGPSEALNEPIPKGMVWNMIYDSSLLQKGLLESISHDELLQRYKYFLDKLLPVAEEANVKLALHPDDPPLKELRKQPRIGYYPRHYKEIMDLHKSPYHVMELCLGTIAEMEEGDIFKTVDYFARRDKIGYIHFRNIRGSVSYYKETFIDEGDVDMPGVLNILKENNYEGILIPDHTPQMSCDAPWHAGMAYAMGYINGLLQMLNNKEKRDKSL